jgi:hypothetical protein
VAHAPAAQHQNSHCMNIAARTLSPLSALQTSHRMLALERWGPWTARLQVAYCIIGVDPTKSKGTWGASVPDPTEQKQKLGMRADLSPDEAASEKANASRKDHTARQRILQTSKGLMIQLIPALPVVRIPGIRAPLFHASTDAGTLTTNMQDSCPCGRKCNQGCRKRHGQGLDAALTSYFVHGP